jgi:hypothetical protein
MYFAYNIFTFSHIQTQLGSHDNMQQHTTETMAFRQITQSLTNVARRSFHTSRPRFAEAAAADADGE